MKLFSLANFPLTTPAGSKTVFLRVDYNVPIQDKKILDNRKISTSLDTIKFLLSKNCKIVLATHLGRPNGRKVNELKVDPVVEELKRLLKQKITKLDDCIGRKTKETIEKGKQKEIFFLENLRFYKQEKENNPIFAHSLARLGDVYVNDAFAVSHRKHASLDAITTFLPALPGLLMQKELSNLEKALHPRKPAIWVIGGAKLDKIDLINQALKKADHILIGGALPFAFLKAKGIRTGMSKTDRSSIRMAKSILRKGTARKIILPIDFVVTEKMSANAKTEIVKFNQIKEQQIALDVGPKTIDLFKRHLRKAHTVVWNGPLGYFEWAKFAKATKEIGRFLGKLTAFSIVGGGETAEALHKFRLTHGITHISTGGGAALLFLSGKKLPALEALEKNYRKFGKQLRSWG